MSELKELLERSVRFVGSDSSTELVEADVERGRRALARRRHRQMIRSSVVGAAAATVLAATALTGAFIEPETDPIGPRGTPGEAQVQLVAYTGDQPDGFVVDRVPEGWTIQGSSAFALTIAPEGDDTHPDNFMGKLVVMLLSASAKQELPEGEKVEVGNNEGVISTEGGDGITILTYEDGDGHLVQVQSPEKLGWTNEQLADFAEGVKVTGDAEQTVG